jgi:hypothetical protein
LFAHALEGNLALSSHPTSRESAFFGAQIIFDKTTPMVFLLRG